MKTVNRFVAWICLFSTTVMGCYTTSLIEPTGNERQRIERGEIIRVVMKDGTRYKFDKPAILVEGAIIGQTEIKQSDGEYSSREVSLPITDVAEVHLSEHDGVKTAVLGRVIFAVVVAGAIVISEVSSINYADSWGK